jgi:hypothetical protein
MIFSEKPVSIFPDHALEFESSLSSNPREGAGDKGASGYDRAVLWLAMVFWKPRE